MSTKPKVISLIIKVTTACNMNCKYCYMDKNADRNEILDVDVLERIISSAQKNFSEVHYVWHGGEPLLAGSKYYYLISMLQSFYKKEDQIISNVIQTNGSLLSAKYIQNLWSYGMNIGISYDANDPLQNPSRTFPINKVTEPIVRKRIDKIKALGKSIGVLCVVTRENVDDAKGILKRLADIGVNGVSFLPFKKNRHATDMGVEPDQWANFLIETFEFWLQNNHSIRNIEPISSMVQGLLGQSPTLCTYNGPCFKRYLSIYPQGDIYPCCGLVGPEFMLGNIMTHDLGEIFESSALKQMRSEWRYQVENHCKECSFVSFCNGGCPEYTYFDNQRLCVSEQECISRKLVFSHIKERLSNTLPSGLIEAINNPMKLDLILS